MPFGPAPSTQDRKPPTPLPEGYPAGWWVPARSPAAMCVEGSQEMDAQEYRAAFLAKLAAAIAAAS